MLHASHHNPSLTHTHTHTTTTTTITHTSTHKHTHTHTHTHTHSQGGIKGQLVSRPLDNWPHVTQLLETWQSVVVLDVKRRWGDGGEGRRVCVRWTLVAEDRSWCNTAHPLIWLAWRVIAQVVIRHLTSGWNLDDGQVSLVCAWYYAKMYMRISEYGKVKKGPNGVKKVQKYGVKCPKSQKGPKKVQKGSKGPKEAKRSKFLGLGPKKVQNGNPGA